MRSQTWSPAAPAVGSADYLVGNPSAVALADGRAMLIYVKHSAKCEGDCGTGNGLVVSEDDGITWCLRPSLIQSPNDWNIEYSSLASTVYTHTPCLCLYRSSPQDLSADFGAASGSLPGPGTALQVSQRCSPGQLTTLKVHFRSFSQLITQEIAS